jgi:nicotinic acid mononucleotide adenylyltransferase
LEPTTGREYRAERTSEHSARERLTKVPKGGNWQQHKEDTTENKNRASGAIRKVSFWGGVKTRYSFLHLRNATATTKTTNHINATQAEEEKIDLIFGADNRQEIQSKTNE